MLDFCSPAITSGHRSPCLLSRTADIILPIMNKTQDIILPIMNRTPDTILSTLNVADRLLTLTLLHVKGCLLGSSFQLSFVLHCSSASSWSKSHRVSGLMSASEKPASFRCWCNAEFWRKIKAAAIAYRPDKTWSEIQSGIGWHNEKCWAFHHLPSGRKLNCTCTMDHKVTRYRN